jgi:serine/threonine-protein kinase RsbW
MTHSHTVRIEFGSAFDMLDFVQVVSDHIGRMAGLDDDSLHWVSVAVRECVVNAIKHGNQNDESKRVVVEFSPVPPHDPEELVIRVEDEGEGFDPEELPDPLAPENILRSSGRGIFLIRSFMDDVTLQRAPEGGMEIRMIKRVQPAA